MTRAVPGAAPHFSVMLTAPPHGTSTVLGTPWLPMRMEWLPQRTRTGSGAVPTTFSSTKMRCPADDAGDLTSP